MPNTGEAPTDAELDDLTGETRRANEHSRDMSRRVVGIETDVLNLRHDHAELSRRVDDLRSDGKQQHLATGQLLHEILTRLPPPPGQPTPEQVHRVTLVGAAIAGAAAAWKAITSFWRPD